MRRSNCRATGVPSGEIQRNLGVATNILSDRLQTLVDEGILERRAVSDRSDRFEYRLTAMGRYEDFRWVTSRALDFALSSTGAGLPGDQTRRLAWFQSGARVCGPRQNGR